MRCWLTSTRARQLTHIQKTSTKSTCKYGLNHPNLMPVMSSFYVASHMLLLLEG